MFAKPYKLKSNNTLKNSEKKNLTQRMKNEFPKTSEEKLKELVPAKSTCVCMKLVLNSGDSVNVYAVDNVPMVIETAEGLVPTVCALWKVPDLVPVLAIHALVLSKIQSGVPLYLPGVVIPTHGVGFPMFTRGAVIAMCTDDNAAPAIVGRSAMSSADMLLRAAGVCLETLHIIGDQLCKDAKFNKIERPKMGAASYGAGDIAERLAIDINQLSIQPSVREEWPSLGPPQHAAVARNEPKLITMEVKTEEIQEETELDADDTMLTDSSQIEEDSIPSDMDGLLQWCFLTFLKVEGKRVELPLKTNLLYKNHIQAMCPPHRTLDVKKSSYKKLGKFLEAMQKEGLVEVREIDKGVDAVVSLSLQNSLLAAHSVPPGLLHELRAPPAVEQREYVPPQVREMFCVTAAVAPVLAPHKKGTAVTPGEARAALSQYVRERNLSAAGRGAVTLDANLAKVVGQPEQEAVKWDVLMAAVQSKMTPSTEMRFSDGSVRLTKTKLEPIKMQVVNRSGNKKVTLVSNLETFGFSLPALSHVCQTGVAASCGVTRSPGARCDQLMVQGDQTHFVAKLLIEKYGLPKKFVEGADKALNKKK